MSTSISQLLLNSISIKSNTAGKDEVEVGKQSYEHGPQQLAQGAQDVAQGQETNACGSKECNDSINKAGHLFGNFMKGNSSSSLREDLLHLLFSITKGPSIGGVQVPRPDVPHPERPPSPGNIANATHIGLGGLGISRG